MSPRLFPIFVLLALLLAAVAAAGEPCAPGARPCDDRAVPGAAVRPQGDAPTPPLLGAPVTPTTTPLGDGGPSLLAALARLVGAVLVIALLMTGAILGYRRLAQRSGTRTGMLGWATGWTDESSADAIRVASRRYLGGRESVAVIHAGGERFLVGITAGQVSLISRLDSPMADALPDFTELLSHATVPAPPAGDVPSASDELRAAVERSRERLGRLAHLSLVTREPRG